MTYNIKTTDAISLARKGISKQDILNTLQQSWEIPVEYFNLLGITHYHIKYWQGKYLRMQLADGNILDHKAQLCYQVIYHKSCTAALAFKASQVRISFRAGLYGNYALVQLIPQTYTELRAQEN